MLKVVKRRMRHASVFVLALLAIELMDEFVFGTREAAWPLIRDDLGLTYVQIGLLIGLPGVIAGFIEPFIGVLGDVWRRRVLILGGGLFFALSLFLTGVSDHFAILMVSFILFYPSSGAFVNLAQASLMDYDPARREHNMARWTLAGSLGVVLGALMLGVSVAAGIGWRGQFIVLGVLTLVLLAFVWRFPFPNGNGDSEAPGNLFTGLRDAFRALRRWELLRWLTLLECANLMMDVLLGYLALYFVDVVGVTEAEAGIAVAVWTVVGLVGDVLLIPLLERVRGLSYLRVSAALELVLFTAFLLVPNVWAKMALLGALGFFNAGWYSILQAQVYNSMPGQSGTVMTIDNIFGFIGSLIPFGVGLLAENLGLGVAMWALLLGPIVLLVGIPRQRGGASR
jgi:FSR family fosmidomycin resistance protein-like MFS transporter